MGTNHYGVHIHAMTAEDLHSKSDIAVELAWRDLRIEQLSGENAALKAENCIQDFIIAAVKDLVRESDGVTGWHRNDDVATWDEVLPELSHSETPATTRALNEIKARGVDEWIASRNGRWNGTTKEAELFAASLRGKYEIKP